VCLLFAGGFARKGFTRTVFWTVQVMESHLVAIGGLLSEREKERTIDNLREGGSKGGKVA